MHDNHLLSVADILEKLEQSGETYNKTSVYRSIDQLLEKGLVCQHYFTDDQAMYELREDHHTHLICKKCKKIQITECNYHHTKAPKGFKVDHHHVTLVGLCKNCQ